MITSDLKLVIMFPPLVATQDHLNIFILWFNEMYTVSYVSSFSLTLLIQLIHNNSMPFFRKIKSSVTHYFFII